jgi:multicomponent Na+:H+ antiporter subunit G
MDTPSLKECVALTAIVAGTVFSVLGILGMVRLPDVFTRLHATGKVSVFGVVLLLAAAGLLTPGGLGRAAVLIVALLIAGPVLSHIIADAARRKRVRMTRAAETPLKK